MNNMVVFTLVDEFGNKGEKMAFNKDFIVSVAESDFYFSSIHKERNSSVPTSTKACHIHVLVVRQKGFLFGKKICPICFTVDESFDDIVKQLKE